MTNVRLFYQLNLSFGALLLCVLTITAVLLYPLLSQTIVDRQRQEMQTQGGILISFAVPSVAATPAESTRLPARPTVALNESAIATVLYAPDEQVIYSNLPSAEAVKWIELSKQSKLDQGIWREEDDNYIVETASNNGLTAVMATPVSEIQSLQLSLFLRMLLILFVSAVTAFLLSTRITKRLVTPLADLRKELKKVEARRFSEVRLVASEGEIGEVANSVYQLAGVLEKYQLTQKQFFQNASHELKTPLTSIQGYAEGIKDGIFTEESAEKGLNVIVNECIRLKKIVTEMILLEKLESEEGIFHMEKVSVQDLMTQTLERIDPLLVQKGLQVRMSDSGKEHTICADREKLLQALINILSNAARYAKETIEFQASANDNRIVIEIADDGEGISDELLPLLFQRFAKGKNGETGLGLAISRAIVERCNGQISARNQPDGGALFTLHFPKSSL